jgi:hypothetical protein
MDTKTIIILILSSLLSAAAGYLYSMRQRKARKFHGIKGGKKKMGGRKKKMGDRKKMMGDRKKMMGGDKKIKGADDAKGELPVVQSGVAQYAIENGL